jgi:ATP-binding cassette subfamily F protein uup
MDNVITSVMVFEDDGNVKEYLGSYSDWVQHGGKLLDVDVNPKASANKHKNKVSPGTKYAVNYPLSNKKKRAIEEALALIEGLEAEQTALEKLMSDPNFYTSETNNIEETLKRTSAIKVELAVAYAKWESVENN